ncbi:MAG: peptide deformylase [Thermoleophilaceae bacterium]|jgi:peptide deformylase|nr:peptide deformylase [Thermoleophilaceae bacterium]
MSVREVLRYPHPALKAVADELDPVDDAAEVARVAGDMLDTLRATGYTTGLAATQLGELVRIVAVDVTGHRKTTVGNGEFVMLNPVLVEAEGGEVGREGCLSLPDLTANVRRATRIVVEGTTPAGEPLTIRTEGFEARCLLHELDHLDGILFLDRVDSLTADVFRRKKYG